MGVCNGVCHLLTTNRLPKVQAGSKYKNHSYCTTCARWFENKLLATVPMPMVGIRCPCCHTKLRRHSRCNRERTIRIESSVRDCNNRSVT